MQDNWHAHPHNPKMDFVQDCIHFFVITFLSQPQVSIQADIMNGNISVLTTLWSYSRLHPSSRQYLSMSSLQAPWPFHLLQNLVLSSTGLGLPSAWGYLGLIWGGVESVTLAGGQHTFIRLASSSNPHAASMGDVGLSRRLGHLSSVTHSVRVSNPTWFRFLSAQVRPAIVILSSANSVGLSSASPT